MEYSNLVELIGVIVYASFKETSKGYPMFKCKLSIPVEYKTSSNEIINKSNQINIIAWGDLAKSMRSLKTGQSIKVVGSLQQRSFESKCRSCDGPQTIWFTDVVINNFVEV